MRLRRDYQPRHRGGVDLLETVYAPALWSAYTPRHARRLRLAEVARTW